MKICVPVDIKVNGKKRKIEIIYRDSETGKYYLQMPRWSAGDPEWSYAGNDLKEAVATFIRRKDDFYWNEKVEIEPCDQ